MNQSEAKEYILANLWPYLKAKNFHRVKAEKNHIDFRRINEVGFEGYYCSMLDYNPIQIITDYYYIRIERVEQIMIDLQQKIKIKPIINKESSTFDFSYSSLNEIKSNVYLPDMETEEDVIKSTDMIKEFMTKTAFPLLDRFNDIREIDKEINGEKPWEDDWQKRFNFGSGFNLRRLIIARLANNPRYSDLIEWTFQRFEKMAKNQGKEFPGRDNFDWSIAYAIHFLEDIEPIYEG